MTPLRLAAAAAADAGVERTANQDAYVVRLWPEPTPATPARRGLFAVADGVGGEAHGEVASSMACELLLEAVWDDLTRNSPVVKPDGVYAGVVRDISLRLEAEAEADARLAGMSTTLTALLLDETGAIIAHVGDSRAYFLDEAGRFWCCTQDHAIAGADLTEAERAEVGGEVSESVLTQALGSREVDPQITRVGLGQRGRFLLCSDGLHGLVSDAEIQQAVAQALDIQRAAEGLVEAANRRGGPDNITVVLVDFVRAL